MNHTALIPNYLAFISVLLYVGTLGPSLVRIFYKPFYKSKVVKFLNRNRREVGIWAWVFGLAHGVAMVIKYDVSFLELKTYVTFFQGLALITIFTILAITSNDLSVKKLKKNWKKIHSLTYIAAYLLIWHIWDKMSGMWSWVTPISLFITIFVSILLTLRLLKNIQKRLTKIGK
jgi:sulfoxide reductase heme-binding subunit YedZ